jgi:hypothetical protein
MPFLAAKHAENRDDPIAMCRDDRRAVPKPSPGVAAMGGEFLLKLRDLGAEDEFTTVDQNLIFFAVV